MNKPQWITIGVALASVAVIYAFTSIKPPAGKPKPAAVAGHDEQGGDHEGHDHSGGLHVIATDTLLNLAKKQLKPEQQLRLATLENGITRGDVKEQQLHVYHQLANFWRDSVGIFIPYAWYTSEAARLENSEKSLTFAAHLLLTFLPREKNPELRTWEGLQAKDLFERSLKLNPGNDSSIVGLGAAHLYGNLSPDKPMEWLSHVKKVSDKDSTNEFALSMLVTGNMISGQYDNAIKRLNTLVRLYPQNAGYILQLADVYDRTGDKKNAVEWYKKGQQHAETGEIKGEIEKRIKELQK
jgi:tetratricopeptide (TPR) repeat protein